MSDEKVNKIVVASTPFKNQMDFYRYAMQDAKQMAAEAGRLMKMKAEVANATEAYDSSNHPWNRLPETLEERLVETIGMLRKQLEKAEDVLNKAKEIKFKAGDVVVIPTLGNGIIESIKYASRDNYAEGPVTDDSDIGDNRRPTKRDEKEKYIDGIYAKVISRYGSRNVPIEKLIPYTEASQVLYDKPTR